MRKIILSLISVSMLLICALNFAGAALETAGVPSPPMPGVFWGTAIIDGGNASSGDIITAYDSDGILCGTFDVTTDGYYGYIGVKGDNLNTTGVDEGATENDTITFYINGIEAGTGVWNEGEIHEVNLAASILICGDVTCDTNVDIGDAILLINYVFYPGQYTICSQWAADVNGDNKIDIGDAILLINYVFYPGQYTLSCT